MLILLLGTLKPANFHSLVSSANQPNHSFTSPKGTKAVKTLSLNGTKDFLFLPISPKIFFSPDVPGVIVALKALPL